MAQEDQTHDGEEIFVAGKITVGAQLIRRRPQALFKCFDIGFRYVGLLPFDSKGGVAAAHSLRQGHGAIVNLFARAAISCTASASSSGVGRGYQCSP